MTRTPILVAVLGFCLLPLGCRQDRVSFLDTKTIDRYAARDYPDDAPYGPDLDVVAVGKRSHLHLTNRSPSPIASKHLWLNRQYVTDLQPLAVGTHTQIPLTNFINFYHEPYPVPGLLIPGNAFPVVLAELYDPETGLRNRLLVQTTGDRPVGIEGQN